MRAVGPAIADDDKTDGLIAGHPDRLFANRESCSPLTIEPSIGADLPERTVVGAAAELHTESEALHIEVVPRKPVAGNAPEPREPFPPADGLDRGFNKIKWLTWGRVQFLCTKVLRFFTIRSPDVALSAPLLMRRARR
jgi:hypothetical protein